MNACTHTLTHTHTQANTLQRHSIYFHIFRSPLLDGYAHSYAEAYVRAHHLHPNTQYTTRFMLAITI